MDSGIPPTVWVILLIVAVIVVRRMNPMAGGAMGACLAIGVGIWGHTVYDAGGRLALASFELNRWAFYGLVLVWLSLEVSFLVRTIQRRRQRRAADE